VLSLALLLAYPFFLHQLGSANYGIWVLASSIANYLQAADLGFGVALVHYVADDHLSGSHKRIWQRYSASVIVFGCAAAVLLPGLAWGLPAILRYGGLTSSSLETGLWAGRLLLFVAFFRVLSTVPTAVLSGIGDMSMGYRWDAIGIAVGTVAMCGALLAGTGIPGLAYASFVTPLIVLAGTTLSIARRVPLHSVGDLLPRRQQFLDLGRYGAQVQVTSLASLAIHPVSRLLVSRFGVLAHVSALDLAEKIVLGLRGIVVAFLAPALPAAARARDSLVQQTERRQAQIHKAILWMGAPLAVFLWLVSKTLLATWLGTGIDLSFATFTMRALLLVYLANVFLVFPFLTMQGSGDAAGPMYSQLAGALVTIGLGLFLGSTFGPRGVVVGLSTGILTATLGTWVAFVRWKRTTSTSAVPHL